MKFAVKRRHIAYIIGAVIGLLLILWGIWCYVAFGHVDSQKSKVTIERQAWYEVEIDGKPVLYFSRADSDSVFTDLAERRDTAITRTTASGQWINQHWWVASCKGTIIASMDSLDQPTFSPLDVVNINLKNSEQQLKNLEKMKVEMEYFFSVHDVKDEGYELVTAKYEATLTDIENLNGVIARLKQCVNAKSLTIRHKAFYRAAYNKRGKERADTCLLIEQVPFESYTPKDSRALKTIFQLKSKRTPLGKRAVSFINDSVFHLSYAIQSRYVEKEDTLDGFGLKVTPQKGVQLGEWKEGKFKGERLVYNSQRIYGIDISRFQHEIGNKKYKIHWDRLRITSLGTNARRKIQGKVDYKVSFVYIKATEGKTVINNYYSDDYAQAQGHGLKVGTYHFFSTKTSGKEQAAWFLKNLRYRKGDFPPVLDVEPSDAQIAAMGGAEKMFESIRAWIKAVEVKTGTRPILYISQMFVNKYLPLAPDIIDDYQVWIARYSEYKPEIHMAYWQFASDGKVEGIASSVDINVFNGYQTKYDEFISGLK